MQSFLKDRKAIAKRFALHANAKHDKLAGGDIRVKILKKCDCIFEILTNSINQSIDTFNFSDCLRTDTYNFSDCLKTANITPVFKNDDPLYKLNYRPFGVLPLLSKVYERLFIMNYLISLKVY